MYVAESASAPSAAPRAAPATVVARAINPWTHEDVRLAARHMRSLIDPRIGEPGTSLVQFDELQYVSLHSWETTRPPY